MIYYYIKSVRCSLQITNRGAREARCDEEAVATVGVEAATATDMAEVAAGVADSGAPLIGREAIAAETGSQRGETENGLKLPVMGSRPTTGGALEAAVDPGEAAVST